MKAKEPRKQTKPMRHAAAQRRHERGETRKEERAEHRMGSRGYERKGK